MTHSVCSQRQNCLRLRHRHISLAPLHHLWLLRCKSKSHCRQPSHQQRSTSPWIRRQTNRCAAPDVRSNKEMFPEYKAPDRNVSFRMIYPTTCTDKKTRIRKIKLTEAGSQQTDKVTVRLQSLKCNLLQRRNFGWTLCRSDLQLLETFGVSKCGQKRLILGFTTALRPFWEIWPQV